MQLELIRCVSDTGHVSLTGAQMLSLLSTHVLRLLVLVLLQCYDSNITAVHDAVTSGACVHFTTILTSFVFDGE